MRRLWLKFLLWRSGYCTKHYRQRVRWQGLVAHGSYCPACQNEAYERWKHRLRLMREEYQELDADR